MFLSYRNQSVDLQTKSADWFLYDRNIVRWSVNCYKYVVKSFPRYVFIIKDFNKLKRK